MVLKKPYAFLIKNFMLIHIILTGAMIYVCARFNNCMSFIKEYINNSAPISLADTYINLGMYLCILLILGISFVIFWLMKYKSKPKLLYFINIGFYVIILVLTIVLGSTFGSLEDQVLDSKTIRMFRDVVRIAIYVQYAFIVIMSIRALGFDVKKFNFSSDIQDIAIDSGDNEEFELTVGLDFEKIKRSVRRYFRELRYYYEENRTIILIILGVVVFIIGINLLMNITINKVYDQNDYITSTYFEMNVVNSYTTKYKYDGSDVSIKDKTYLVVQIDVRSLYNNDKYELDTSDFLLEVKDSVYLPTKKYYQYFKDIGHGYDKQVLSYNDYASYILVFLVDDNLIDKKKVLKYHEGYRYTDRKYVSSDKRIAITPVNLDNSSLVSTTNLDDKLEYLDTVIGSGSITIKDFEFNTRYDYSSSNIITAGYNKIVLRLGIESSYEGYYNYEFFNDFVDLYYVKDDKIIKASFKNKTPKRSDDNVYLEVDKILEEADSIYLEIGLRNNVYKYKIK